MASRSSLLPFLGMLVLLVCFGQLAVHGAPDGGDAIGVWPVGLACAMLLVSRRPPTAVVLAVVFATAFATIWTDRPVGVALGLSLGIVAETWVVWRRLTGGERARPGLYTIGDLGRFLGASALGFLVMGSAGLLTSLVTGWSDPWLLALAVGTSSLASQLTVTPFFCRLRPHRGPAAPLSG